MIMMFHVRGLRSSRLGIAVAVLLLPTLVVAADRLKKVPKPGQYNPDHQTVEMFSAIEKGQIAVKLIPKDSTECKVLVENKTDQPLNVKVPEAFAGVPVLAQVANRNNNNNNVGGGGGNQSFGGGMMGGMGMMNVPPEKVGKFDVPIVCLEHGKKDPRPAIPYDVKPIEGFTDKAAVHELLKLLGSAKISQRAAQVAAWHLSNDMSWQELAAKRIRHANGSSEPYFSAAELKAGVQVAAMATTMAEGRKASPGETESASAR